MLNEEQFAIEYATNFKFVRNVCRAIVGDSIGIDEDLAQDTFLKAWQHRDQFRGDAAFSTWLYRVAANVCYDHLRKATLQTEELEQGEWYDRTCVPVYAMVDNEDAAITRIDMERLLNQLAPGQREKLLKYGLEGKNHREIAAEEGIQESSSRAHIRQARKRAREVSNATQQNDRPLAKGTRRSANRRRG